MSSGRVDDSLRSPTQFGRVEYLNVPCAPSCDDHVRRFGKRATNGELRDTPSFLHYLAMRSIIGWLSDRRSAARRIVQQISVQLYMAGAAAPHNTA